MSSIGRSVRVWRFKYTKKSITFSTPEVSTIAAKLGDETYDKVDKTKKEERLSEAKLEKKKRNLKVKNKNKRRKQAGSCLRQTITKNYIEQVSSVQFDFFCFNTAPYACSLLGKLLSFR